MAEASDMVGGIVPPNEKPDRGATGNPLGQMNGDLVERFMKSYNITLSESELLDVVTALAQIAGSVLRRGAAATEMYELSRRITDQAAEQFHDGRQLYDGRQQLSLPYEPTTLDELVDRLTEMEES